MFCEINEKMNDNVQVMSLLEFNGEIKSAVESSMLRSWVVGEINEVHRAANGHVYLELVEKSAHNGTLVAKLRCTIWSYMAAQIVPRFAQETGQDLQVGQKVVILGKLTLYNGEPEVNSGNKIISIE